MRSDTLKKLYPDLWESVISTVSEELSKTVNQVAESAAKNVCQVHHDKLMAKQKGVKYGK